MMIQTIYNSDTSFKSYVYLKFPRQNKNTLPQAGTTQMHRYYILMHLAFIQSFPDMWTLIALTPVEASIRVSGQSHMHTVFD